MAGNADLAGINGHFDARRLKLDTLSIIGLCCVVGYFAWTVNDERNAIKKEIQTLGINLDTLAERLLARTQERWTRGDMQAWCLEFRIQNPSVKCPDPYRQQVQMPDVVAKTPRKTPAGGAKRNPDLPW